MMQGSLAVRWAVLQNWRRRDVDDAKPKTTFDVHAEQLPTTDFQKSQLQKNTPEPQQRYN